ncbi:DUF1642 domain-containing protein [Oenococcus oeni]|uniref:DUF1642 domain-containing protein n=1 Tax=Oenococcus oeni TaxID=1247 RepID=UPI001645CEA1|nr:DUF1642 domain-containing protein [Oenococcus oeni]
MDPAYPRHEVLIDTTLPDNLKEQPVYIYEPVKLPKFVADWINENLTTRKISKERFLRNIDFVMVITDASDETFKWYRHTENSSLIVAEAILYGYEIEDET